MASPRLKKQRADIRAALDNVIELCEDSIRTGNAVSEHIDSLVEGSIQAGACERIVDVCTQLRGLVVED